MYDEKNYLGESLIQATISQSALIQLRSFYDFIDDHEISENQLELIQMLVGSDQFDCMSRGQRADFMFFINMSFKTLKLLRPAIGSVV